MNSEELSNQENLHPSEETASPEGMIEQTPEAESELPLEPEPQVYVAEISENQPTEEIELIETINALQQQKQSLEAEIDLLKAQKNELIAEQTAQLQAKINSLVEEGLTELEQRKQALIVSIEQLERRRERISEEMRTSFAGVSQELAIRVQGFKDYLVGSLQDLAAAAEQLELARSDGWETNQQPVSSTTEPSSPQFGNQTFKQEKQKIRELLEQYRRNPDYYGPPWQLRRTFEPIHAERVEKWFLTQGGRGSVRSMGSCLQNILLASAVISVLYAMYGDRCAILVLANSPERLGEWRRGLQDCLGISRSDFGPNRGITLFESPEALVQKADLLVEEKRLPVVIIDEGEEQVSLSLLQFPLWLAFAPEPQPSYSYTY